MVSSNNIYLKSWDHTAINLPFSKVAFLLGKPVWVNSNIGDEQFESVRLNIETQLKELTKQANEIVGANRQIGMMD